MRAYTLSFSFWRRSSPSTIQSPGLAGAECEKDEKQHQEGNVIEIVADVAPSWRAVSGRVPGGKRQCEHVHRAAERGQADPEAKQHRECDQQLAPRSEEHTSELQ